MNRAIFVPGIAFGGTTSNFYANSTHQIVAATIRQCEQLDIGAGQMKN
jgi:hypothetical protein